MILLNDALLISPCGMNCYICTAYLRKKNKCPGCRIDVNKPVTRFICKIKKCEILTKDRLTFCFECENFPCKNLEHLDKRYRTRYSMSMIENLENIKKSGMEEFLRNEKIRWECTECGGTICVHKGICYDCGRKI
jgi:hypothetical protein